MNDVQESASVQSFAHATQVTLYNNFDAIDVLLQFTFNFLYLFSTNSALDGHVAFVKIKSIIEKYNMLAVYKQSFFYLICNSMITIYTFFKYLLIIPCASSTRMKYMISKKSSLISDK